MPGRGDRPIVPSTSSSYVHGPALPDRSPLALSPPAPVTGVTFCVALFEIERVTRVQGRDSIELVLEIFGVEGKQR